ncbi:MAG: hypothetical protein ACRDKH_03055 [Solirubrobacterales bacterium]
MSQPPPPTERIHLSPPSVMPALLAVGLAAVIVGLYAWWPYSAAGALIAVYGLVGWLRGNRDEIARMPVEQKTDTAPIPLTGRE